MMKTDRAELKRRAKRALMGNYGTMILAVLVAMAVQWALSFVLQMFLFGDRVLRILLSGGWFFREPHFGMTAHFPWYRIVLAGLLGFLFSWMTALLHVGMNRMVLDVSLSGRSATSRLWWAFSRRPFRLLWFRLLTCLLGLAAAAPLAVTGTALAVLLGRGGSHSHRLLFLSLFTAVYGLIFLAFCVLLWLNYGLVYYVLADCPEMGVTESLRTARRMMRGNRMRYLTMELSFLGWKLMEAVTAGIGSFWIMPYTRCTLAMFYLDLKSSRAAGAAYGRS